MGRLLEDVVEEAIQLRPSISDPHSRQYLGTKAHIIKVLAPVLDVVHSQVTAGPRGTIELGFHGNKDVFNRDYPSSRMFRMHSGAEVHVGGNEAACSAAAGGENRNEFTHFVEARHDSSWNPIRGRVGPGRDHFPPGTWRLFDINMYMKKCNVDKDWAIDAILEFIHWIGLVLLGPNSKLLVYCDLAAWVNEIALLLQYGPASTALDNGRNSGCSDTRKTSNEAFIKTVTMNNSSNIGSFI